MAWTITYSAGERVLTITTSGVLTPSALADMVRDALAEGRRRGVHRYLVDHRQVTLAVTTLDLYEWPKRMMELGVSHEDRVAIVIRENSAQRADFDFAETRAFNAGFRHKTFTDPTVALRWLTQRK